MLTEVAIGNNNSGGLQTVIVQPDYDGLQYPRETYSGSGVVYVDGKPFLDMRFPDYVSADDWVAILSQFGLSSAKTALITIRVLGPDKETGTNYNGRVIRPEYGQVTRWEMCWYKAPRLRVYRLEAL